MIKFLLLNLVLDKFLFFKVLKIYFRLDWFFENLVFCRLISFLVTPCTKKSRRSGKQCLNNFCWWALFVGYLQTSRRETFHEACKWEVGGSGWFVLFVRSHGRSIQGIILSLLLRSRSDRWARKWLGYQSQGRLCTVRNVYQLFHKICKDRECLWERCDES
jgi:hypothetical protein